MRYAEGLEEPRVWLIFAGLWLLFAAQGCSGVKRTGQVIGPPGQLSARGVLVTTPPGLDAELVGQCLQEVDQQQVPGWIAVEVREAPWSDPQAPPGQVAWGQTDMRSWIRVALAKDRASRPLLPALEHEMLHVMTQDPKAGH